MINSLQVVAYQALLDLKSPGNASSFNEYFKDAADAEVVDTATIFTENIMYLPEQDSLSLSLQDQGIDSTMIVNALGMIFYTTLFFGFIAILNVLLYFVERKCKPRRSISQKISKYLYWNTLIRFLMEAYLDFYLCAFLNIKTIFWNKNLPGVQFCNVLSIMVIAGLIPLSIFIIVFYARNVKRWNDPEFESKYGSLLEGVKKDHKSWPGAVLLIPALHFIRRIVFAATIVFWFDMLWGQIAFQYALSTTMIIFL